jgi:hypothetical protein
LELRFDREDVDGDDEDDDVSAVWVGARAVLAAVTRASKIRGSSPSSGFHCTPMPNL